MVNWKIVPVSEILIHKNNFIKIDDSKTYRRVRIKIHRQGMVLRDEVRGHEIKTKSQQVCKSGQFLVAEIDAKVGGYGIVPEELEGAIVSSHYFLFDINNKKVNLDYFKICIKTDYFFSQIKAEGTTNYASIRPKDVLKIQIPLPPLDEQKKIAENVNNFFKAKEQINQFNLSNESYISSLRQQILQEIFSKKHFSNNLEIVKLGDVVKLADGTKISGVKHPYLEARYLRKRKEPIMIDEGEFVEKNELIMLVDGENSGEVFELKEGGYLGSTFKILKFNFRIDKRYLQYFILLNKEIYKNSKKGVAIPHLDKTLFRETNFPLPLLAEQKRIVEKVDKLMAYCDELEKQVKENQENSEKLMEAVLRESFE